MGSILTYSLSYARACVQINVAALVADYAVDIGDANRPEDAPTSEVVTSADLLAEYEDFGDDIRSVIGCIERPLRWYINVVYPHLPTYVKGRVALLGDAVRGSATKKNQDRLPSSRCGLS